MLGLKYRPARQLFHVCPLSLPPGKGTLPCGSPTLHHVLNFFNTLICFEKSASYLPLAIIET